MTPRPQTVDSHQHFWSLARFDYAWMPPGSSVLRRDYLPDDLRPLLDAAGVARTVAVQAHQSVAETRWLLSLAEETPWIAGVVGWVDLTSPSLGETLDSLMLSPKLKGIRHLVHDESDPRWLVRPDVLAGLGEVSRRGLAFDLLLRPEHIACVPVVANACPDLLLIVDHIAKPCIAARVFEPWAADIAEIARIPGLRCKVSGMVTEADHATWTPADLAPYVAHVVGCFGAERLVFGSDWPVCRLAATYGQVVDALDECLVAAGCTESERQAIFGPNATRFYRLG